MRQANPWRLVLWPALATLAVTMLTLWMALTVVLGVLVAAPIAALAGTRRRRPAVA